MPAAFEKMKEVHATLENLARRRRPARRRSIRRRHRMKRSSCAEADQTHVHWEEQKDIRDQVLKLLAKVGGEGDTGKGPLGEPVAKQKSWPRKPPSFRKS